MVVEINITLNNGHQYRLHSVILVILIMRTCTAIEGLAFTNKNITEITYPEGFQMY